MHAIVAEINAETEDEDNKEILTEKRDPAMDFCLFTVCIHSFRADMVLKLISKQWYRISGNIHLPLCNGLDLPGDHP